MSNSIVVKNIIVSDKLKQVIKENPIMNLSLKILRQNIKNGEYMVQMPVPLEYIGEDDIIDPLKYVTNEIMKEYVMINDNNGCVSTYPLAMASGYKNGIIFIAFNKKVAPYIINLI